MANAHKQPNNRGGYGDCWVNLIRTLQHLQTDLVFSKIWEDSEREAQQDWDQNAVHFLF